MPLTITTTDPTAERLIRAIRTGDTDDLSEQLAANPELATARLQERNGERTPLHVCTDWPGYFPNAPRTARMLLDAGADPSAAAANGQFAETPLHWAASSDDVDVATVLIDGGADLEAPGGSIAVTPLANAIGYGCWHVARLLVARGAAVDVLWQAAALGLEPRVRELLGAHPKPTGEQLDEAFWQACHGGQRRTAALLLECGASINASPGYASQTPLAIVQEKDTRRDLLAAWLRELGAE